MIEAFPLGADAQAARQKAYRANLTTSADPSAGFIAEPLVEVGILSPNGPGLC